MLYFVFKHFLYYFCTEPKNKKTECNGAIIPPENEAYQLNMTEISKTCEHKNLDVLVVFFYIYFTYQIA